MKTKCSKLFWDSCVMAMLRWSCARAGLCAGENPLDLRLRVGPQQDLFFLSVLGELQQIEVCESVHNPAWSDWAVSLALGTLFALFPVVVHLLYLRNKCWNHIWDTLPPLHHGLADPSQPLLGGFVFWGFFLTCYYYHENISRPQGRWGKNLFKNSNYS